MLIRMANLTDRQLQQIKCKCDYIRMDKLNDFMSRLSIKLRIERNQIPLSYGDMVELFLQEAGITYLEAHKMSSYELKRIYRELCKKEPTNRKKRK